MWASATFLLKLTQSSGTMNCLTNCLIFVSILHVSYMNVVTSQYKSYKNYKLYELSGDNAVLEMLLKYVTANYDVPFHEHKSSKVHILLPPADSKSFEEFTDAVNVNRKLLVPDYAEIIRSEAVSQFSPRSKEFSWTSYYDVDDIYNYLQNVSQSYADSTEVIVGGQSYEGRQILGLRINTDKNGREGKPVMFVESGIHAREWITPATTTYFINQLLTSNDPNITAMRDEFDWRIFPTVNPDGYHYTFTGDRMWRKTRSKSTWKCYGADPNRNWDYNWLKHGATNDPCDYQVYAGSRPFSEVETRTLSEYISGIDNLLVYVAFHSYAQALLLPYSDSVDHVDNYDDLVQIGKTSLEYGRAVNGEKYDGPGTAAEILYKASGGSMDWVRHALGTPLVFTYELRGVYFHWPASRISEQGDEVTQMMLGLATEARNLGYY